MEINETSLQLNSSKEWEFNDNVFRCTALATITFRVPLLVNLYSKKAAVLQPLLRWPSYTVIAILWLKNKTAERLNKNQTAAVTYKKLLFELLHNDLLPDLELFLSNPMLRPMVAA